MAAVYDSLYYQCLRYFRSDRLLHLRAATHCGTPCTIHMRPIDAHTTYGAPWSTFNSHHNEHRRPQAQQYAVLRFAIMFGSHNLVRGEANAVLWLRFLPVSKSQGSLTSGSDMFRQRARHRTQCHVAFHCSIVLVSKFFPRSRQTLYIGKALGICRSGSCDVASFRGSANRESGTRAGCLNEFLALRHPTPENPAQHSLTS